MSNDDNVIPLPSRQTGRNIFGGKNPHGLYVPMSNEEQEVLSRLVEADDLELVIHGWAVLARPQIQFGDLRISIVFRLDFNGPAVPTPVHFFDLELRTRAGLTLFRERQPVQVNGKPLEVCAGVYIEMAWDIAIDHMDPALVKAIKPGARGLTSRRLDKDTGQRTLTGNMQLTSTEKATLKIVEDGAAKVRATDAQRAIKATQDAGYEVKQTPEGPIAPDID